MNFQLEIEGHIWQKEFFSIYDYITNDVDYFSTKVSSSTVIYRDKNDVFFKEIKPKIKIEKPSQNSIFLSEIQYTNGIFTLISQNNSIYNEKTDNYAYYNWIVLGKSKLSNSEDPVLNKNIYYLKEEDVFKMGKIMFRVLEINIINKQIGNESVKINNYIDNVNNIRNPQNKSQIIIETDPHIQSHINSRREEAIINDLSHEDLRDIENRLTPTNSNLDDISCRICLAEGIDDDPLICVCKCSGSVRFIHINCLKHWLKSREAVKQYKNLTVITFKSSK